MYLLNLQHNVMLMCSLSAIAEPVVNCTYSVAQKK